MIVLIILIILLIYLKFTGKLNTESYKRNKIHVIMFFALAFLSIYLLINSALNFYFGEGFKVDNLYVAFFIFFIAQYYMFFAIYEHFKIKDEVNRLDNNVVSNIKIANETNIKKNINHIFYLITFLVFFLIIPNLVGIILINSNKIYKPTYPSIESSLNSNIKNRAETINTVEENNKYYNSKTDLKTKSNNIKNDGFQSSNIFYVIIGSAFILLSVIVLVAYLIVPKTSIINSTKNLVKKTKDVVTKNCEKYNIDFEKIKSNKKLKKYLIIILIICLVLSTSIGRNLIKIPIYIVTGLLQLCSINISLILSEVHINISIETIMSFFYIIIFSFISLIIYKYISKTTFFNPVKEMVHRMYKKIISIDYKKLNDTYIHTEKLKNLSKEKYNKGKEKLSNFIKKCNKYKSSALKATILVVKILLIISIFVIGYVIYYYMPLIKESMYRNPDEFWLILIATFIISSPLLFIFLNKMLSRAENYYTVSMYRVLISVMLIVLCSILLIIILIAGGLILLAALINHREMAESWPLALAIIYLIFSIYIGFTSYKRKIL